MDVFDSYGPTRACARGVPNVPTTGMLVYAAGEALDTVHEVRHLGKRLVIAPVDLGVPPEHILKQVAALANRVVPMGRAA